MFSNAQTKLAREDVYMERVGRKRNHCSNEWKDYVVRSISAAIEGEELASCLPSGC